MTVGMRCIPPYLPSLGERRAVGSNSRRYDDSLVASRRLLVLVVRGSLECLLNVSAGSQKRAIHEPEGRDESRFALKLKRNLDVTIVKYILSLWTNTVTIWTNNLSGPSDVVSKATPRVPFGGFCRPSPPTK